MVRTKSNESEGTIIVEIAGGSASGKTSAVADKIREIFNEEALILSMDDYYRGPTYMDEQAARGNILNWDQPEALNIELLKHHLEMLKNGQAIDKPVYDFVHDPVETKKIEPKKIIILEGLFALDSKISNLGDIKAFVDIGTHGRIIRRLLRDVARTGQKPEDTLKYFAEVIQPMHDKYIQSSKERADVVLNNEYRSEVEAKRSGLNENQLKFKLEGDINENTLRDMGAERLTSVKQKDKYYSPHGKDLSKTDELLRIREEGEKRILTYKDPKNENQSYRERPKFEFEIDKETEEVFLGMYGGMIKTISKDRTYYQLNNVIISLDRVQKIDGEQQTSLGNFIEVRASESLGHEKVEAVINKLNLKKEDGIKDAYTEM